MGLADVGELSLGEWSAIRSRGTRAQGEGKPEAPSDDEFDRAVMAARGVS